MFDLEKKLRLPKELSFSFTRSSKPGGQNVNKVNTRVTLFFDVLASEILSDEQKKLILERLATRISKKGVLHVVSYRHRTQAGNRKAVVERFFELIQNALLINRPRIKTKIPKRVKRLRLDAKKHRGMTKKNRRVKIDFE